ncbi:MAG: hypothetical protein IJH48_08600 [Oscillospiraceae bacterium]|nr:hypothetical protein [Oscillospiraceae bacterium]
METPPDTKNGGREALPDHFSTEAEKNQEGEKKPINWKLYPFSRNIYSYRAAETLIFQKKKAKERKNLQFSRSVI